MSALKTSRPSTLDDLLAMADGEPCELVDGQLVVLQRTPGCSRIAQILEWKLREHCTDEIGRVFSSERLYRCDPARNTVRRPDASVILAHRLPVEIPACFAIAPDIAIDVTKPSDRATAVFARLHEYQAAGVRLVWLVCPEVRQVGVWRPYRTGRDLYDTDELTGEDVLPGFRCRVADPFQDTPRK